MSPTERRPIIAVNDSSKENPFTVARQMRSAAPTTTIVGSTHRGTAPRADAIVSMRVRSIGRSCDPVGTEVASAAPHDPLRSIRFPRLEIVKCGSRGASEPVAVCSGGVDVV